MYSYLNCFNPLLERLSGGWKKKRGFHLCSGESISEPAYLGCFRLVLNSWEILGSCIIPTHTCAHPPCPCLLGLLLVSQGGFEASHPSSNSSLSLFLCVWVFFLFGWFFPRHQSSAGVPDEFVQAYKIF